MGWDAALRELESVLGRNVLRLDYARQLEPLSALMVEAALLPDTDDAATCERLARCS